MSATAETTTSRVGFELRAEGSVGTLYKSDDDFVIWGPASVEVVDKEDDRIKASALKEALPQLLKRRRLSYEHSDQIVGEILKEFETEEPVSVQVGGEVIERSVFPTDVLKGELDEPALFVAGKVYGDTQKSEEVRKAIEAGDIRSYSISGEAIVSSMAVEGGRPVTDIEKLDLSAVTLCAEGMNQKAKFGVVKKMDPSEGPDAAPLGPNQAAAVIKSTMSGDTEGESPLTKSGMESILDKHLPDGDLATKEDVRSIARETAEDVVKENATNTVDEESGSTDRPSGDDSDPVESDPGGGSEGDKPDEVATDSDKMEEKSAAITMDQLKSALPDDQFKAIQPVLQEKMGEMDQETLVDDDPMEEDPFEAPGEEPAEAPPTESVEPEPDPVEPEEELDLVEEKAKALGLDPGMLSKSQQDKLAQVDLNDLQKADGVTGPASDTQPAAGGSDGDLAKMENTTLSGSNFFDADGGVKL